MEITISQHIIDLQLNEYIIEAVHNNFALATVTMIHFQDNWSKTKINPIHFALFVAMISRRLYTHIIRGV